MKNIPALLLLLVAASRCPGQVDIGRLTDSIAKEGRRLYKSEMASWYGTDLFVERFKDRERIGGYFSYSDSDGNKCIFFSKGDTPRVLGTILFDDSYRTQSAKVDLEEREFTGMEHELWALRTSALKTAQTDSLFKWYEHMNFNLIPLVIGDERKVYALTGPEQDGIVVFGNDYLLTYDKDNTLVSKKQLHRNIITVDYGQAAKKGQEVVSTMHSHLPETGDFITATDICTLMLYEKIAKWKQHMVVSASYVSLWNCETDQLVILTKEAMDKIYKDQEQRHKKN
jgi:hypothetical protein